MFNAAAAAAASAAAAAASAAAAAAAREKQEKGVISMLSPSRGKLSPKFGNISSRLSNTPRSSPRERAVGESEVPGSFGFFSMNDVTIVWYVASCIAHSTLYYHHPYTYRGIQCVKLAMISLDVKATALVAGIRHQVSQIVIKRFSQMNLASMLQRQRSVWFVDCRE
jgi:hypothetical protein